jgi:DNA repair exonuclease SbcCD ATPase subunit
MRPIPDKIKAEIIQNYLEGYSIPKISQMRGVAVGTVDKVTDEEARKDESIVYIREIAKMFKKKNLELAEVIAGVRLYNKVKKVGLSQSFFENFLESTNTESYRLEMEHDQFIENIKRILQFEQQYQIKTEEIPEFIQNKMEENENLKEEYNQGEENIDKLYSQYHVKKSELEDYKKEQDWFWRYKKDYSKYMYWMVPEKLFEEAYIRMGKRFKPEILFEKIKAIYTKPNEHTDIIKKILNMDKDIDEHVSE